MKYMPTWYCKSIYEIDLQVLKNNNVKYILTDLDNTLAPYNVALPDERAINVIETIKKEGFNVIIVSNNTGKRVELFSSKLNVDYISGAKKPFTSTITNQLMSRNIPIEECVLIGDQLMTDIKCATRLKCKCVLTEPLVKKEALVTFINRKIDRYYRRKYNLADNCTRIDRSDSNESKN